MRFGFIILLTILAHVAFTSSRMTVSLYALKLQASPFTVGVLMSLYALLPMLLSVPAGRLIDRIGPRLPLLWGNGLLFCGVLLPFLAPGLPALFVAATMIGCGFMLSHMIANNLVGAYGKPEDRAANFSWLALGFSVSGSLGPLVAGFSIDGLGEVRAFAVMAAFAALALGVTFWKRGDLVRHANPQHRPSGHSVMDLLRDRRLTSVLIASGMLSMGWDLFTFVMPIHCSKIGLTASTTGIIMGFFGAATFVVRLGMPMLSRRLREWQVITAAFVVSGSAYMLFPFVTNATLMMAIAFLLGLGLGCAQPMVMSLLYSASPPGRQGEVVGIRTTVLNTSSTMLPLVFGAVGSALGMGPVFGAISLCLAAGGYAAGRKARRLK
ncbi:MAG: MFS transporter [Proteobacteria bacterium]|nr:MFS transporter [Pseudomonadota bacterium]